MSRLTNLISQLKTKDPELGKELEREFKNLASRRSFGLNFERHKPESVELSGQPVRKGDKVRILPPRGSTKKGDQRLWKVLQLKNVNNERVAQIELRDVDEPDQKQIAVEDLVVVAEFQDYIYPGLESTGKVERGDDKPYHTVINGENFHSLEALTFTHRAKVDVIYIDPPYNSGAKDWKYNNNYVEKDDLYRHSKWLAFIERRIKVAKELLNPHKSALIVTVDEKEVHRLGLLLEQTFPDSNIQMISSVINRKGTARGREFYRVDEYLFYITFGSASISDIAVPGLCISENEEDELNEKNNNDNSIRWGSLLRSGSDAQREDRKNNFYPIYFDTEKLKIIRSGEPLPLGKDPKGPAIKDGILEVWPIRQDGSQGRWQLQTTTFNKYLKKGYIKIGGYTEGSDTLTFYYLMKGQIKQLNEGELIVTGEDEYGGLIYQLRDSSNAGGRPKTHWNAKSHSATDYGTSLLNKFLPGRKFPFPKSLYAVEDSLRFLVNDNKNALILDFFSGSGTTAHAVMRLNHQDGGERKCICVTNNEVAADEQITLRKEKLRPGDPDWEKWGICDYITKPRIKAAITGKTHKGMKIKGDYKFTDEFPMAEGFNENAEFFTLTYESPVAVNHNLAFARIAPLLWMRAGSEGRRIEEIPEMGWDMADTYGLLTDLDQAAAFSIAIESNTKIRIAYIVTDDQRRFQSVVRRLPDSVEPVRLYESYLTNFRFSVGR